MIDREIFINIILFVGFIVASILAGGFIQDAKCEKLATELQHYPKCQVAKYPLYCVRQHKKIEDLERQINNGR